MNRADEFRAISMTAQKRTQYDSILKDMRKHAEKSGDYDYCPNGYLEKETSIRLEADGFVVRRQSDCRDVEPHFNLISWAPSPPPPSSLLQNKGQDN